MFKKNDFYLSESYHLPKIAFKLSKTFEETENIAEE